MGGQTPSPRPIHSEISTFQGTSMSTSAKIVQARSHGACELCQSTNNTSVYDIPSGSKSPADPALMVCATCLQQIESSADLDANHWRCLNESMWSEVPAVKVISWRLLNRLSQHGWAQDLIGQLYLEDELLAWAQDDGAEKQSSGGGAVAKDSNGNVLSDGDSVTLIKDLEVKGAGFTAKRGTLVKNISLTNNPEQIEGRVNGTQIVLLTRFLKKA